MYRSLNRISHNNVLPLLLKELKDIINGTSVLNPLPSRYQTLNLFQNHTIYNSNHYSHNVSVFKSMKRIKENGCNTQKETSVTQNYLLFGAKDSVLFIPFDH